MYTRPIDGSECRSFLIIDPIQEYFKAVETLIKAEKWEEIIEQSTAPLAEAKEVKRHADATKIYVQRTSAFFKLGKYAEALESMLCCDALFNDFENPLLTIHALYLKSAVYRALAGQSQIEEEQQKSYRQAIETAEAALHVYVEEKIKNEKLLGKVYFNLGAAHADNPKGALPDAVLCYQTALKCFEISNSLEDQIRTHVRMGKIHLLRNEYEALKGLIQKARVGPLPERLIMHIDYLEAQYLIAVQDYDNAERMTKSGLARAVILHAEEDQHRFNSLLIKIREKLEVFSHVDGST